MNHALFSVFGALAQYERALTRERVAAGLAAAKRRGRNGGRPPALAAEKTGQIIDALENGASKASVCRSFGVARSTLADTLRRAGWTGPTKPQAGRADPEAAGPRDRPKPGAKARHGR